MSDDIFRVAVAILDTTKLTQPVRQLGVRLSNLKYHAEQLSLFEEVQKKSDAIKAMDSINDRYGEFKVRTLDQGKAFYGAPSSISTVITVR